MVKYCILIFIDNKTDKVGFQKVMTIDSIIKKIITNIYYHTIHISSYKFVKQIYMKNYFFIA